MNIYQLTCSCGDIIEIRAQNADDAVDALQRAMDQPAIVMHVREKHPEKEVLDVVESLMLVAIQ
jgi:hypothetical protein